jgi:hypothetical protein
MAMVPDSHTRGNDKLLAVKRNRNFEGTSWYSKGTNRTEGVGKMHMVIQGVRSGGFLGFGAELLAGNLSTTKYRNVKGSKSMDAFNAVTLHEIGHGVDAKEKFMKQRRGVKDFGAWQKHSIDDIAALAAQHFDLFGAFPGLKPMFLHSWLVAAMGKGFNPKTYAAQLAGLKKVSKDDLLQDRGVARAVTWADDGANHDADEDARVSEAKSARRQVRLKGDGKALAELVIDGVVLHGKKVDDVLQQLTDAGAPEGLDVSALADHAATRWCRAIVMSGGESGLWEDPKEARKLAIDGRVYQESYTGSFCSYDVSAQDNRVTNYQLRAEGEWFADAYSAYYLKKLPDSHPLTTWLDQQSTPPQG